MLLSEFIEHMQNLMAKHGDHKVWLEESDGGNIPYRAEWFIFQAEEYGGMPANVYTI